MPAPGAQTDLRELVHHREHVTVDAPLEHVQQFFSHSGFGYLGVIDQGRFAGVASERMIATLLSARFGHALFGRARVGDYVMIDPLVVSPDMPLTDVLQAVSARKDDLFFADIGLVDRDGGFLGLIPVERLVRLQTALLLENIDALEASRREVATKNRQMERDLRMACEVQRAFLPAPTFRVRLFARERELTTAHAYRPADLVGGDFFDVFPVGRSAVGLLVCDVMGHGVRSALVTAMVRALVEDSRDLAADPGALLTRLNRKLMQLLRSTGELIFVTAAYVVVDLARGTLNYAQAGHPPAVIARAGGAAARRLALESDAEGPALGLLEDVAFASVVQPFEAGDRLLLFTDGLLEAASVDEREEFGWERLLGAVADLAGIDPAGIVAGLVERLEAFGGSAPLRDDVCLLAVGVDAVETGSESSFVDDTNGLLSASA